MLKNIVSKFADRGKEHQSTSDNGNMNKVPEGFLCPKCLASFSNPELLQSHYHLHHDERQTESQSAVTLQNYSAFYDDSVAELEVEDNDGSDGAVSPEVHVTLPVGENELRKRLASVIQSNALKDQKIKVLESRANQLTHDYSALKMHNEEERAMQNALQERIKVLEAQLTQRASLDDATALRHGLIQVQQAMDQMALERERERDEYKEKLQCLQDTVNKEAEHTALDKEKLSRVVGEYVQLQAKLKTFQEKIVNAQQLINTNQFSSYEHALRRVNIQLEWLKTASKDALVTNFRELKELKALLSRGNNGIASIDEELDEDFEPGFEACALESTVTTPDELQDLQPDMLPIKKEKSADENLEERSQLHEVGEELMASEKEKNDLERRNKELERECALQREEIGQMKDTISDLEKKLQPIVLQLSHSCAQDLTQEEMDIYADEKSVLLMRNRDMEVKHSEQMRTNLYLNNKVCDMEDKVNVLCNELSASHTEEVELRHTVNEMTIERAALQEELKKMREKISIQEEKITYLGVQRTSVETSLFELQKSFAELELEKANQKKNLIAEFGQVAEKNVQLEKEMKEMLSKEEAVRESFVRQENEYETKLQALEKEKQVLESNCKNLEEKLLLEEQLKNDLKKQMEEVRKVVTDLGSQLEDQRKCHMQELYENSKVLEAKQAALDEVAGEKLALEAQIETLQTEQKVLLERCYTSAAEAEQLRRTHVEACRSQEEVQAALQELGRENQTLQMKMDKLLGRKWAEDADVTNCTKCKKEFSLIVRKHHCRNCFKIFCNECSSRVAAIEIDKKPVRVCEMCYGELAHK